ncbi:MAG: DUF4177 domain-containing protein [Bacteroidota bacterium]
MKKFEYKMLTISVSHLSSKNFRNELNQKFKDYGEDGWELVKMEPIVRGGMFTYGGTTKEFFTVFQREKQ